MSAPAVIEEVPTPALDDRDDDMVHIVIDGDDKTLCGLPHDDMECIGPVKSDDDDVCVVCNDLYWGLK